MKFDLVLQACVECLVVMPTLEDCRFCIKCGVILCEMCFSSNLSNSRHRKECDLFVEAGHKFQIRLVKLMAENNADQSHNALRTEIMKMLRR